MATNSERSAARAERQAKRPAPQRLLLGHWLPSILTGAITAAIPAILISAYLVGERREAERRAHREAYLAQIRKNGPDCALELERDICLCADFRSRSEAEAYVDAQKRALGQAPRGRFGLYTDGSDRPCAHLPAQ